MNYTSKYSRETLDPGVHGHYFYTMYFTILHSLFYSHKYFSYYYNVKEEADYQLGVTNMGLNHLKYFNDYETRFITFEMLVSIF